MKSITVTPAPRKPRITPDGRYKMYGYKIRVIQDLEVGAATEYSALSWVNGLSVAEFEQRGAKVIGVQILNAKGEIVASNAREEARLQKWKEEQERRRAEAAKAPPIQPVKQTPLAQTAPPKAAQSA